MPFNPNTPRSRDEVLLQAIVSGDSSKMGEPRDREEEFVKAIADRAALPDSSEASTGDILQLGEDGAEWTPVSKKYEHLIKCHTKTVNILIDIYCRLITDSSDPIDTNGKFNDAVRAVGGYIPASGIYTTFTNNKTFIFMSINAGGSSGGTVKMTGGYLDADTVSIQDITDNSVTNSYIYNVSDTVREI